MALKGTLIWLCSLAVWSSSALQDETLVRNCTSQADNLQAALKQVEAECGENLPWTTQQTAALLLLVRNLTDALHEHQLKECQGAEPSGCPEAEVPDNGGLACVTVANRRFCKPLCNHGYDFGFVRRSRPYEECSEQKRFKWDTQYIGGNVLAVCNKALIQVAGGATAYFPKDQDCLTTKSSSQLQDSVITDLTTELNNQGVQGKPHSACLVCGRP